MFRRVEIFFCFEKYDVRFRFILSIQPYRSLHANDCLVSSSVHQGAVGAIYGSSVRRSDRAHRQDLAFNEFHRISLTQNAGIHHAVVIVNGE
jgi:hypothetical protein